MVVPFYSHQLYMSFNCYPKLAKIPSYDFLQKFYVLTIRFRYVIKVIHFGRQLCSPLYHQRRTKVIHFELNFFVVWGKGWSSFCMWISSCSQHHLLKRLYFSRWIILISLNQLNVLIVYICMDLFLGLYCWFDLHVSYANITLYWLI